MWKKIIFRILSYSCSFFSNWKIKSNFRVHKEGCSKFEQPSLCTLKFDYNDSHMIILLIFTCSFVPDVEDFEQPSLQNKKGITSTQLAIKSIRRCHICGKLQSCQANLDRHMRVHTGDKPYASEKCGKKIIFRIIFLILFLSFQIGRLNQISAFIKRVVQNLNNPLYAHCNLIIMIVIWLFY